MWYLFGRIFGFECGFFYYLLWNILILLVVKVNCIELLDNSCVKFVYRF